MSMKKMMTTAAVAAILAGMGLVPSAYADVSVEDVKCVQRYPWNGLVDIEYTIACDDPNAEIYVNPVGFNGDTGLTVFPTHFTGDGATNTVKAGRHTMVWAAKADLGNLFATKNFQIKMYAGKKLSRYIVIDISGGTEAENYPIRYSIEGPNLDDDTCRTTEIWMRLIPPGTLMMGSPEDEVGRADNEDLHKVTLTQPYYMGVFEVTQRQWELVMGDRPSYFNNDAEYATRPVEQIAYSRVRGNPDNFKITATTFDGNSFLGILQRKTQKSGFDLPTEAQWEHACRAGSVSALYNGTYLSGTTSSQTLNDICRYKANGYNDSSYNRSSSISLTTAKVGMYQANAFGLYDMIGNVWEYCRDGYETGSGDSYKNNGHLGFEEQIDPLCTYEYNSDSSWPWYKYWNRIYRGGGWTSASSLCRSANRSRTCVLRRENNDYSDQNVVNDIGFRIYCSSTFDK